MPAGLRYINYCSYLQLVNDIIYFYYLGTSGGLYCPPGIPYRVCMDSTHIAQTVQTVCGLHLDSARNFFGRTSCQFWIPSPSPVLVQFTDCPSKFIRTAQMLGLSWNVSTDWSLMICADRSMCICRQGPLHNLKSKLQYWESNPRHKTNPSKYFWYINHYTMVALVAYFF